MVVEEIEEVGMRTRRKREKMGENSRHGKRLRNQLKELDREAERAFVAAEMTCGALASGFQVNEIEAENVNIRGRKLEKEQEHLKIPMKRVVWCCGVHFWGTC